MEWTIQGQHFPITDALRTHVQEKLSRLQRLAPITGISVRLKIEAGTPEQSQHAEATVHGLGCNLHVCTTHHDMYAAIDALAPRLQRAIQRHHHKSGQRRNSIRTIGADAHDVSFDDVIVAAASNHAVHSRPRPAF